MPRVSSTVKAVAIALAVSLAGAASAHAASTASERQIRANLAAQAPGERCHGGYFCIYEDRDFDGASLGMSACRTYKLHSYRFTDQFGHRDRWDLEASSWVNDQIGDVAATLRHRNGSTFRAPIGKDKFMNPPWNDRVVRVKPC
jgi:hypothetical protein